MISERLSVVASALGGDPRKAPRLAREAKFRGMLFDVWSTALNIPDLSDTGRREYLRLLSDENQQLVGLRMDLGGKGLMPGADVDRQIDRMHTAIRTAAELRTIACVDLGPLPPATQVAKPKPVIPPQQAGLIIIPEMNAPSAPEAPAPPPDPVAVSQINAALNEIGSLADRYSVVLALSSSLASLAALDAALAASKCPWFGVDLDTVALLGDQWSADEAFSVLGRLIRHVRARDAIIGEDHRSKPAIIGRGDTNWRELLSQLDQAGYSGFFTVDPMDLSDRAAAASAGAAQLRAMSE